MHYSVFERPRERLKARGARSLTTTELLQLVLGSGSSSASAAKLARQVVPLLGSAELTYEALVAVKGLGDAKACQILATNELSTRLLQVHTLPASKSATNSTETFFEELKSLSHPSIKYVTLDGSGSVLKERRRSLKANEHYGLVARRVYADALSDGAGSVLVGIGWKNQLLNASLAELRLAKSLQDTSVLLQLPVSKIVLVNKQGSVTLSMEKQ